MRVKPAAEPQNEFSLLRKGSELKDNSMTSSSAYTDDARARHRKYPVAIKPAARGTADSFLRKRCQAYHASGRNRHPVFRRPERLGTPHHCGLTPSIAASASPSWRWNGLIHDRIVAGRRATLPCGGARGTVAALPARIYVWGRGSAFPACV
jgi:hypothetical protein